MPGLDDDFGVTGRRELVTVLLQFRAQFMMVVDRAVEHHAHAKRVVDERLMGAQRQIHDAETAMAETATADTEHAFAIRTTSLLRAGNIGDGSDIGSLLIETKFSGNSAHR